MSSLGDVEYSQRVVFFVDILAFQRKVQELPARQIQAVLQKIRDVTKDIPETMITQFSDSIILSFRDDTPSGLFNAIITILHLQIKLLGEDNVLVRGACSLGKMYHSAEYCFGPATNEAYMLQEKCAIYPRIIIAENIIKRCSEYSIHPNYNDEQDIKELLRQDTDGYWYIDYLSKEVVNPELDTEEQGDFYQQQLRQLIQTGISESDVSVQQKYLWLQEKCMVSD